MRLPTGFSYRVDQGIDTFEGHFTSADGAVVVRHDIGGYAGAWASRKGALAFHERVVGRARVWTAKRDWPDGQAGHTLLVAVTFPDSGCANFFVKSSKPEDAATIEFIATSFRPKALSDPCVKLTADLIRLVGQYETAHVVNPSERSLEPDVAGLRVDCRGLVHWAQTAFWDVEPIDCR